MFEDALYCELAAKLPVLLSPAQEQSLWESVIEEAGHAQGLLSVPRAARLAREAWTLAQEWSIAPRLGTVPAGEDCRAFAQWANRYQRLTARNGQIERARLPQLLEPLVADAAIRKPRLLFLYGFDIETPQQQALFDSLRSAGVEVRSATPEDRAVSASRIAFASAKEELQAAASWARARLESRPDARIGVVVPTLGHSRHAVRRIFTQTMDPARPLAETDSVLPFNLSLGEPLGAYPIVASVFLIAAIASQRVPYGEVSRLLRSPYIAAAQSELAARAALDAALGRMANAEVDLDALRLLVARAQGESPRKTPSCPGLVSLLQGVASWSARESSGLKSAAHWAQSVERLLRAAGHPGERALDAVEHQALAKWHELLAEFASLDSVAPRMRFADACSRLIHLAGETLFQPEAASVPVQVLGVLESGALGFDHLWVSGLTEEAWPLGVKPHPFIPTALQRSAGVPQASALQSLELDRRMTQGWLCAAPEVVFSHALREQDRDLAPSPLIAHLPAVSFETLALPQYETLAGAMRRESRMEILRCDPAPALGAANGIAMPVRGGTSVFRDQAACPFRAFAVHRLGAEVVEQPVPGLDARDRGTLLHAMLAKLWSVLKNKSRLDVATERDLRSLTAEAADTAIGRLLWQRPGALAGRFAEIERSRLVHLAREWLKCEQVRADFEVVAIEEKHAVAFGGVQVNAKLDRMDRIGGRHVVIDYKTGRVNVADWLGPRPQEPQLPLYALARGDDRESGICGVAFARVRAGDMAFRGIASEPGLIPGVGDAAAQRQATPWGFRSWSELVALWRAEFETLGREFAAGEARIDPKQGEQTCRYCELRALCRIHERTSISFDDPQSPEPA